ncbi:heptaprenyl diphosphate synthase component 1 [Psychrobacillus sp. Sa2BUA9]|uniref:Heptaprenyl diphosphate synthase component 1 n=1 Tax=Psychrobacillus faecigallinarum TaxID=2762235 RepID=A0ABR8RBQ3_9BACI|nr:heptaprenyl diphosphate synthase component 1 [Psychrobacillus faecigallinarum]MBD7945186.1 heptaprenyl diphosphate synthase component 1 [Psychrobacillus faecigallinarum]QGM30403.1 hypothetical protein GI482_08460 [Bacillus sp. N3536]
MNESLIKHHIEQYKKDILMQIQHNTLLKYAGIPVIDEDRLFFTLLPLLNGEEWAEANKQSTIAVSLIFAALAAHDLVKEQNATTKEQQLQVLAGDYYSGKYYQLLAKGKQIELIQIFSSGVSSITEHKTRFYDHLDYSYGELMQSIQLIESKPIEQFMEHFSYNEYVFIMKEALLLLALRRELNAYENREETFYIRNSFLLQTKIETLRTEMEAVEKNLVRDVRYSNILKENVKHAILERVTEQALKSS